MSAALFSDIADGFAPPVVRPGLTTPSPARPGLPNDVLAILVAQHAYLVRAMRGINAVSSEFGDPASTFAALTMDHEASAYRIRQALRSNGLPKIADALADQGEGVMSGPDIDASHGMHK